MANNKLIVHEEGKGWVVTYPDGSAETFETRVEARAALKAYKASH